MTWTALVFYLLSLIGVKEHVDEPSRQGPPALSAARTNDDGSSGYHRADASVLDISNGF